MAAVLMSTVLDGNMAAVHVEAWQDGGSMATAAWQQQLNVILPRTWHFPQLLASLPGIVGGA